jgi:predicted PurR-regulated permease PerM
MGILGLDFALPAASFAGLAVVVPVIGPFIAIVPPILVAVLTGDAWRIVVAVVALVGLQQIVVNVVGPKVVGDALGLHPMVVLAALLIGIRVAGLYGALFAIPAAGVLFAMGYSLWRRQRLARPDPLYTQPEVDAGRSPR